MMKILMEWGSLIALGLMAGSAQAQSIVDIAAGSQSTCVLESEGRVRCWGGSLGGAMAGIPEAHLLSAMGSTTCALLEGGSVSCWTAQDPQPQTLKNPSADNPSVAIGLSVGQDHACVLDASGQVYCWGSNLMGQIGAGPWLGIQASTPIRVSLTQSARSLVAGSRHSCAVLADTSVACWGNTWPGQGSYLPQPLEGMWGVMALAAGDTLTCGLLTDGRVPCWGSDEFGQLGNGELASAGRIVLANGIREAVAIRAGLYHACALLQNGTIKCWGANTLGQLGNGSHRSSSIPIAVAGISNAKLITAGDLHTCAVLEDDSIQCWGANDSGQLGDGSRQTRSQPVPVIP